MATPLVMTILGEDRPGLVEAVASAVVDCGGNWLESRMARLGGQFAGILRVEVPLEGRGKLLQSLQALEVKGLRIVFHDSAGSTALDEGRLVALELVGQDRPGIVNQVSGALARHGVNVEELETECVSAPMSGEPLFQARVRVRIPGTCDVPALRRDLEKIAADLMVDFTLAAR